MWDPLSTGDGGTKIPLTPGMKDIADLQAPSKFGESHAQDGNTTYKFSQTTADLGHGNLLAGVAGADLKNYVMTIFDRAGSAGGNDTIDASAFNNTQNLYIDLRAGHFSAIGTLGTSAAIAPTGADLNGDGDPDGDTNYNVGIAVGAQIENAKGGSGNDMLVGNTLNNTLEGGGGNDTYVFNGNFGRDTIIDSDNQGIVKINNQTLNGTYQFDSIYKDANYRYIKVNGGKDLLVIDNANANQIVIKNWSTANNFSINLTGSAPTPIGTVMNGDFKKFIDTKSTPSTDDDEYVLVNGNYKQDGTEAGAKDLITGTGAADVIKGLGGDDALNGKDGDDTIEGGDGSDVIQGGDGADRLYGGIGDDKIYGSSDDETKSKPLSINFTKPINTSTNPQGTGFNWTSGYDTTFLNGAPDGYGSFNRNRSPEITGNLIDGGAGNDFIAAGTGVDFVHGGDDKDVIWGMGKDDILFGDAGNDVIFGDGDGGTSTVVWTLADDHGNDIIDGGDGDDILFGQGGDDIIFGGNNNDKIWGDGGSDLNVFAGNSGNDYLDGGDGDDEIWGGSKDDRLLGGIGIDKLYGEDGNDYLDGGAGADLLIGGAGDDTLIGSGEGDILDGGTGKDIYYIGNGDQYQGQTEEDVLNITGSNNASTTGVTKDTTAGSARVMLDMGGGQSVTAIDGLVAKGDAIYTFSDGSQIKHSDLLGNRLNSGVSINSDAPMLFGGKLNDSLRATGATNATLFGGLGDDALTGNVGNNTLIGGAGADIMAGGLGNDTYVVDNTWDVVSETSALATEVDLVQSSVSYTLGVNVENLTLTGTSAANGIGNALNNVLTGNASVNILNGGAGNDTLDGGAGNDSLVGGDGADVYLFGKGSGFDLIQNYDTDVAGTNADSILLGAEIATSDVSLNRKENDLVIFLNGSAETLTVSRYFYSTAYSVENIKFADGTVWNNAVVNTKVLEPKVLIGSAGDDYIEGSDTNDTLMGQAGSDSLVGGAGNDVLDGGSGDDYLLGDAGDDVYRFGRGYGNDFIAEQISTENNVIELGAGIVASDLTFSHVKETYKDSYLTISIKGTTDTLTVTTYFERVYFPEYSNDTMGYDVLSGAPTIKLSNGIIFNQSDVKAATLQGTGGDDLIEGYITDDLIDGGAGNDVMNGGYGDDIYLFGIGYGQDKIFDAYQGLNSGVAQKPMGYDVIKLGAGITPSNLALSWIPISRNNWKNDLLITINGTTDSLLVENFWHENTGPFRLDGDGPTIQFASGEIWNHATILQKAVRPPFVSAAPSNLDDDLFGTVGNDVIHALAGNDLVYGEAGDDQLFGDDGYDVLDGGLGNDTLVGGLGGDNYIVDSALDVVIETSTIPTEIDTVQSSVSYILGDNLEQLYLTGNAAIDATGNALNNRILGNSAANILNGGAGADTMIGLLGNDTYVVDDAGDIVTENAGQGIDTVLASISYVLGANLENITLTGNAAINGTGDALSNVLIGNIAANTLTGGAGNDTLNGGEGADTLIGGTGNDTYVVDNAGDIITETSTLATEIDTVQSSISYSLGANLEKLVLTGTAAINGTGNALANTLTGNAGNNILNGGAGVDTMIGGLGDDIYVVDVATDVVTEGAGAGIDTIQTSVTLATLAANVENLTLTGTSAINATGNALNNTLTGNAAANILNGGAGADTLIGGLGNDTYVVDNVLDVTAETSTLATEIDLVQTSVSYTLSTNIENLTLTGTALINGTGNTLNNTLTGNAAANILDGGAGADTLIGGLGNDTYVVDNIGDIVTETSTLATEIDTVQASISYTLGANVEKLVLTGATAINGIGNALNNTLTGNAAANVLNGGTGTDTMIGGLGDDTYVVDNAGDVVTENANEGTDTIQSSLTLTALAANVEILNLTGTTTINGVGNALSNFLKGNSAANTLADTLGGNDILQGLAGLDILNDTAGNNLFDGGLDADTINAGAGKDLIIGGKGNDTVTTGTGYDVISFNKGDGADIINASTGADNTLSLGGAFAYTDLSLTKTGNDLIVKMGTTDQLTLKDWYLGTTNKSVVNLQVIAEAVTGFTLGGADALRNNKIENFNFANLVAAYDAAGATANWQLTDARLTTHLQAGSDTAAIGGDLAYQYGRNSNLTGVGLLAAQNVINAASFGQTAQTLNNPSVWSAEVVKLG